MYGHMAKAVFVGALAAAIAAPAMGQTALNPGKKDVPEEPKIYSPYVERTVRDKNFAEGLYWGDTHLHTRYSTDAGMIGNKLGPDEAYRFAKGEEVISSTGQGIVTLSEIGPIWTIGRQDKSMKLNALKSSAVGKFQSNRLNVTTPLWCLILYGRF